MKGTFASALVLGLYLTACNSGSNTNQSTDTTTTTSTTTVDTTTTNTAQTSNTPFMDAMNNMMKQMHTMQTTGDPDVDFATMMRHHHQGAIDLSNIELQRGQDTALKSRAQQIIDESQRDIQTLDSFTTNHPAKTGSNSEFSKKAMDMMMKGMSDTSMQLQGGSIDQQFARMMQMHHQQGIEMSREYLKSAKEAATRKVANNVIKTNGEDNKFLKSWMNKRGTDSTAHGRM